MKLLLAGTYDQRGGAARAMFRLMEALAPMTDVRLLCYSRSNSESRVVTPFTTGSRWRAWQMRFARWQNNRTVPRLRRDKQHVWNINHTLNPFADYVHDLTPDVLHLHWVGEGFMPIRALDKLLMPVVWTLHDQWTYTGGCHYAGDCTGFTSSCGNCPQLRQPNVNDLSARMLRERLAAWRDVPLTIVAPSQWMAAQARQSRVLRDKRIEVIPNTLPLHVYQPLDKSMARRALGLPEHRRLILFGTASKTSEQRKGYAEMQAAVAALARHPRAHELGLVILGAENVHVSEWELPVWSVGVLRDDVALALAYSAADCFAAPSRQDNLPNTVLEAMACGVPSVAFHIGGMPDLIVHEQTGMLVQPFDGQAFADAILHTLDHTESYGAAARARAEAFFAPAVVAGQHRALYHSVKEIL